MTKDYSETTIKGELVNIKKTYQNDKGENIIFIVQRQGRDNKPTHEYMISAYTKEGDTDRFGIHSLIGHQVEAHCYVNGRIRPSDNGPFHTIDLNLKNIVRIDN